MSVVAKKGTRWPGRPPCKIFLRMALFASALGAAIVGLSASGSTFTPPVETYDTTELRCLALTIYFEARGEPDAGKRAVGHVVINRMRDGGFPDSMCDVVRQGGDRIRHRCQFSWYCDGRSDRPQKGAEWQRSLVIAEQIYRGASVDPTHGALWYHHRAVSPAWKKGVRARRIGAHLFYRALARRT